MYSKGICNNLQQLKIFLTDTSTICLSLSLKYVIMYLSNGLE